MQFLHSILDCRKKSFLKMRTSPDLVVPVTPYNHASQTGASSNPRGYSAACQWVHQVSEPKGTFWGAQFE